MKQLRYIIATSHNTTLDLDDFNANYPFSTAVAQRFQAPATAAMTITVSSASAANFDEIAFIAAMASKLNVDPSSIRIMGVTDVNGQASVQVSIVETDSNLDNNMSAGTISQSIACADSAGSFQLAAAAGCQSTNTPTNPDTVTVTTETKLNIGLIVGVAVGASVAILIMIIAIVMYRRKAQSTSTTTAWQIGQNTKV